MIELTADEARVLGVLIEKAQTTPNQYPLTVNAIVDGASQKNNRDPIIQFDEDRAEAALDTLRDKGLAVRVDQIGARVHKYRHAAGDQLTARTGEIAILAELLLRGPQTAGELRSRASRMHPFETLEGVKDMLRALMERPEPLVMEVAPAPGSRAERYAQRLCPGLHPIDTPPARPAAAAPTSAAPAEPSLLARIERLESAVRRLAEALGEADPLTEPEEQS